MLPYLIVPLCYVLLGVFAGLCAGLFGLGGGVLVVPVLFYLFHWQQFDGGTTMHLALGSSLAAACFTAAMSTYAHHARGAVLWAAVRDMLPGVVIGALAGSAVARFLPGITLQRLFGAFEMFIAVQLLLGLNPPPSRTLPGATALAGVGAGIGALSAVLGIGGGSLSVPFLLWCNVHLRKAIATSAALGLPIAVAGAAGFVLSGWHLDTLPAGSTGFVYWPAVAGVMVASIVSAPMGARLAHSLPVATVRRLFALLVAAVGIDMLAR